jgi:aminopeptidase N
VLEPWLDEGMTQFAYSLYFQTVSGDKVADQIRSSWQHIQSQKIPVGQPVSAYNDLQYSAIIYGRAPLFIQALHEKMGGEKFVKFLSDYFQKFEWGIVSIEDFGSTSEAACVCNLEHLQSYFDIMIV